MRILLLNQYYHPDIAATAQLCTDWAESLAAQGHDVTVLCGSGRYRVAHHGTVPEGRSTLPLDEMHHGVRIVRVPVEDALPSIGARPSRWDQLGKLSGRLWRYGQFVSRATAQLLRLPRPDVVVALTTPPLVGVLGMLAKRLHRAKLVLWVQDVYPDLLSAIGLATQGSATYIGLAQLAKTLYKTADQIIALDEAMADRLRLVGADAAKLVVIDHFADVKEIRPEPRGLGNIRRLLGLTSEFVVCYAGNHGRGHDFDTIVQALAVQAGAPSKWPPIHWLFIGDGDEKAGLIARIPDALRPLVHVLPPQARSQLPDVLAAGDVGLISVKAEMEGLLAPSKLYGLLAAGRPIAYIGPACGRIPALLRDVDLGISVRNREADALVAGLRALQADPVRWDAISTRARMLAETRFDKPLAMAEHARVLSKFLGTL